MLLAKLRPPSSGPMLLAGDSPAARPLAHHALTDPVIPTGAPRCRDTMFTQQTVRYQSRPYRIEGTGTHERGRAMDSLRRRKRMALVAHDNKKQDLLEWARFNRETLARQVLYATGTTGTLLEQQLGVRVAKLQSGPLGGDQQVGAMISRGELDFLIFFWDPLQPQPHDPDVKALLRMAVVWNIPVACNRSSADFLIASPLMSEPYRRLTPDYATHATRDLGIA